MEEKKPDPWEMTPERKKLAEESAKKWQAKIDEMKNATPVHTETGEKGIFVHFVMCGASLRPLYTTPSGLNFFVPISIRPYKPDTTFPELKESFWRKINEIKPTDGRGLRKVFLSLTYILKEQETHITNDHIKGAIRAIREIRYKKQIPFDLNNADFRELLTIQLLVWYMHFRIEITKPAPPDAPGEFIVS